MQPFAPDITEENLNILKELSDIDTIFEYVRLNEWISGSDLMWADLNESCLYWALSNT